MLQFFHRILVALALLIALPALAQSDPPGRVGRLSYIDNDVFFRVDRNDQGGPAALNWPVSSGAVLETGPRGRAEVWIGSTAYRQGHDSQVEFSAIDDARVDVRLNGGSLAVSILDRDQADDVLIMTPNGNVRFQTPGRYRINVRADYSELIVQAGRATFDDGRRAAPLAGGQMLSRWNDGGERLDAASNPDGFDQWVASRENAALAGPTRRYVSPQMTGYQDLDAYGDWQTAPDYGAVWYPRVADDWAPYRYGRWAWVEPWGWTWVDQAPWGFAPFHYGRWAIVEGRWGWVPGRPVARPVFAPALVGWVGNPGWSVSFSAGAAPAVGWFPLGPREVYVPSHPRSDNYIRQLNVSQVTNVTIIDRAVHGGAPEHFMHQETPRAVTVVPANLLREGKPITAGEVRHPDRSELGRAPVASHAPAANWLAPTAAAVRPQGDARRDPFNGQPARDAGGPQNRPERGTVRPEPENGRRPADALLAPQRREATAPDANRVPPGEPRRDFSRQPPESRPDAERRTRPPENVPAPVAAPAPRSEARPPQPWMQPAEREQRPEVREVPRSERPREMPRSEPEARVPVQPAVREMPRPAPEARVPVQPAVREMPRPAPEVRAPAPPPVREMPPPRAEPPRAEPPRQAERPPERQPERQGSGQHEDPRRRGQDEERGPH